MEAITPTSSQISEEIYGEVRAGASYKDMRHAIT